MKKSGFVLALCLLVGCGVGSETRSTQSTGDVWSEDVTTSVVEVSLPEEEEHAINDLNSSESRTTWKPEKFGEFSVQKIQYCYLNTVNPRFNPKEIGISDDGIRTCNWEFLIQNDNSKWVEEVNVTSYESEMTLDFVDVTNDGEKELQVVESNSGVHGSMTRYFQLNQKKWKILQFAPAYSSKFPVQLEDLVDYIPNDLGEDGGAPSIENGLLRSFGQGPCSPVSDSYELYFRWNGRFFEISHWNYDGEVMKPSKNPKCPPGFTLE